MSTDRSNPKATIGFVIYYPFQFFVYKNVYTHLKDEAEFIIDFGPYYPIRRIEKVLPPIVALLQSHGAKFRVLDESMYYSTAAMDTFLSKYEVLVSVWMRGCMNTLSGMQKKRVNMTYGAGKELATLHVQKRAFDLILAYGGRDHAFYSLLTQSEVVGNPKLDDWFSETVDIQSISSVKQKLGPGRKTVLYLPTHSDLSSIRELATQLKKITDAYNVIVKLHYYTPREEPELTELLRHPSIILLQDDTDLLPLLKVADIVVSDNSSAIFDAVLAEKPIVVTNFHDPEYFDTEHTHSHRYPRGFAPALTFSGSIEQRIKRDGMVDTIKHPSELRSVIAQILKHDKKRHLRDALSRELFAYRDGKSSDRAAEAIRALRGTSKLPEKPFMYHAIGNYTKFALRRPERKAWLQEYVLAKKEYVSLAAEKGTGVLFSIIILPRGNLDSSRALRFAQEQEFPAERFEVLPLPDGPTIGKRVGETITKARGKIICFTTDDCVLPADWLITLYAAYERNPQVGGAGGCEFAALDILTLFDEYRNRELARLLNIPLGQNYLNSMYEVTNQIHSQNPAGRISAMSYRTEIVPPIPASIKTLLQLERFLRARVISVAPLVFIPREVTRLSKLSREDFVSEWAERGVLSTVDGSRPRNGLRGCTDVVRTFVRGNWKMSGVLLLGHLAYSLGRLQGTLQSWMQKVAR